MPVKIILLFQKKNIWFSMSYLIWYGLDFLDDLIKKDFNETKKTGTNIYLSPDYKPNLFKFHGPFRDIF